jgi:hypothetical protein
VFIGEIAGFSRVHFFQRQAKLQLTRHQTGQQRGVRWLVEPSHCAQQYGAVGPQAHLPRQPQAVEEHLAQAQLIFLEGLRRFDPGSNLLQQPLRHAAAQRQQSKERFVLSGRKAEMTGTGGRFPTMAAEFGRLRRAKPLLSALRFVLPPFQTLALCALHFNRTPIGREQPHVGTQFGHHRCLPAFPRFPFAVC